MKHIKLSDFGTLDLNTILKPTLDTNSYILGPSVQKFEKAFAEYTGSESCTATGNCTDSLRMCLQSFGIGPGHKVIVPSFTWLSTAEVVRQLNAYPIYVEVDSSLCVDPGHLKSLLALHDVSAVIYVNLFGNVADIEGIHNILSPLGIPIIEDNAQAAGALYNNKPLGNTPWLSCYSFYPTKNLATIGDAGCVTGPEELVSPIRSLRNHGQSSAKFISDAIGWNSRMDSIHADILLHKLPDLDMHNARRREIAEYYKSNIKIDHMLPVQNAKCTPVYHQYCLLVNNPQLIQQHLADHEIQSRIYYSVPIHLLPKYANGQHLTYTEWLSKRNINIPIHQYLTDEEVEFIVEKVNQCG